MNKLRQKILQSDFYKEVYRDQSYEKIDIDADSIESGMEEASALLRCPIYEISYQIIREGSTGVFGMGVTPYHIRYKREHYEGKSLLKGSKNNSSNYDIGEISNQNVIDKNTEIFIRIKRDGVFLKVSPSIGNGNKITDVSYLNEKLADHFVNNYDNNLAKGILMKSDSNFHLIGKYNEPIDSTEGKIILNISPDSMKASMRISKSKKGGREADYEDFEKAIQKSQIIAGIKKDEAMKAIENQIYDVTTLVAEGALPILGENARVELFFTKEKKYNEIEDTENIDYKNLNNVESVTQDQVVGEKIVATTGEDGYDIFGKTIEAYNGKDLEISDYLGSNVEFDRESKTIKSMIDGQVVITNKLISVEPLLEISGDVGPETGNIDFLGSVLINGSVLDNYSVKAKGNIDIMGSVGKSDILANGNIVVKLGIQGSDINIVKSDGDIFAKFIQFANIEAGGNVVVNEVILNSNIDSENNVFLVGKKAIISGGKVRAYHQILCKTLGSPSSVKTVIETGIKPEYRRKLEALKSERKSILEESEVLHISIKAMEKIQKNKGLDEEKTEQLANETTKLNEFNSRIVDIKEETTNLKLDIDDTKSTSARVCVEKEAFPNVHITVVNAELDLRSDYKATSFFEKDDFISTVPYTLDDAQIKKTIGINTLDIKKTEYKTNA